ncbi:hypothetical protein DQ239_14820 [Blastococcus sp. TF02-09]|uniref:hypothetical protein n=1 Tax=Blastococcus sp. TF02-09 TaxID=2250576 RepID=UPI000DEBEE81|nr:hypothetical protein [Blastococcus sp. TF02-9]RBY76252.1 hypothetical protein DQ239_14820 [Blastococcus sp. TF02-9]
MTSEFGPPSSGPPQGWGPPGYGPPGGPWYPQPYSGPPSPPQDPPSRRTTVLVTAFFGLFGLIPATRHSRQAEQLGVSGSRYYTAFALTLAASALTWTLVAALLVTVVRVGAPAESLAAPTDDVDLDKAKGQQVEGEWTVEGLAWVLEGFADDEYGGDGVDYGFDDTVGALMPCGGYGQELAPDLLDTTLGGYSSIASAQILPDARAAERELARQAEIVQGCTGGYELFGEDGATVDCSASIETLTPDVRYRVDCDDGAGTYFYAIFRSDNAVVTVAVPERVMLDMMLPPLMSELDVD